MATNRRSLVLILVLSFVTVSLAKTCTYWSLSHGTVSIGCDNGCCAKTINLNDYKKEDVCCPPMSSSTLAAIIGGVIGGIVFIVLLLVLCVWCMIKVAKRKQNTARAPHQNQPFSIILTTEGTPSQQAATGTSYSQPPPSYGQVYPAGSLTTPYVNPAFDNNLNAYRDASANNVEATINKPAAPADNIIN